MLVALKKRPQLDGVTAMLFQKLNDVQIVVDLLLTVVMKFHEATIESTAAQPSTQNLRYGRGFDFCASLEILVHRVQKRVAFEPCENFGVLVLGFVVTFVCFWGFHDAAHVLEGCVRLDKQK